MQAYQQQRHQGCQYHPHNPRGLTSGMNTLSPSHCIRSAQTISPTNKTMCKTHLIKNAATRETFCGRSTKPGAGGDICLTCNKANIKALRAAAAAPVPVPVAAAAGVVIAKDTKTIKACVHFVRCNDTGSLVLYCNQNRSVEEREVLRERALTKAMLERPTCERCSSSKHNK